MKRTIAASRMVLVGVVLGGVVLAGLVLVSASAARSEEVLREISWADLKAAGQLRAGEVQPAEPPAYGIRCCCVDCSVPAFSAA